jgi:hypothetical protein
VSINVQLYIVIALSVLITFGLYGFVQYHIKNNTRTLKVLKVIGRYTHIERKGIWSKMQKWLDRNSTPKAEEEKQEKVA